MSASRPLAGPRNHGGGTTQLRQCFVTVGRRLRRRVTRVIALSLIFELLTFMVLAPITSTLLQLFLRRWGRCSVGNFELAAFLTSPVGLVALLVIATIAVAAVYFEVAGLMLLLAAGEPSLRATFARLMRHLRGLCGLALRQVVRYLLLAAPFVAAVAITLAVLWSDYDFNGLIVLRPPVFWLGAGICSLLLLAYAALAMRLFLRWLPSLPLMLSDRSISPRRAMQLSTEATRGRLATLGTGIATWLLIQIVLAAAVMTPLQFGADFALDHIGTSLAAVVPVTGLFLIAHLVAAALLSVVATATFAGLVLSFFAAIQDFRLAAAEEPTPGAVTGRSLTLRTFALATCVLLAISATLSALVLERIRLNDAMQITAHRAGAAEAPENTLAAIRKAIEAGADWAEIDVQRTADAALVVMHDSDLRRVGGVPARVAEMTLAQIRTIDAGSWFSEDFAGEQIPTLDEMIAAAGSHIRLNIELKPTGPDDLTPLVEAVIATARQADILGRCRICSQSYEGVRLAKQLAPEVEIGFIAGAALGDLSELEVDFLMVSTRKATRRLVTRATARGIKVHAWTVNDPGLLLRLVDRGVANVITDDPAAMRARLEEIRDLRPAARLLLRTRNLLAD